MGQDALKGVRPAAHVNSQHSSFALVGILPDPRHQGRHGASLHGSNDTFRELLEGPRLRARRLGKDNRRKVALNNPNVHALLRECDGCRNADWASSNHEHVDRGHLAAAAVKAHTDGMGHLPFNSLAVVGAVWGRSQIVLLIFY